MEPFLIYAFSATVVLLLLLLGLGFIAYNFKAKNADADNQQQAAPRVLQPVNRDLPAGARVRQRRNRLEQARQQPEQDSDAEQEDDLFDYIAQPEGKIGKKKREKLEAKAQKRAEREQMEREREEKRERDALMEEERLKEEAKQRKREAKKTEEERIAREEKEKKEYEEYLIMKESFVIEEEGQDAEQQVNEEDMLSQFVDYVKKMKVVILEDLAAHFKIKTQEAIDRIDTLLAEGMLTGVQDDRGKFIYITKEELEAVAKFIRQRGRVSIQELAESSNRLIRLSPDSADVLT